MFRPPESSVVLILPREQPVSSQEKILMQSVPTGEAPQFSVTVVDKNNKEIRFQVDNPTQPFIRPVFKATDYVPNAEDFITIKSQLHRSGSEYVFHASKEHMVEFLSKNRDVQPENLQDVKEVRINPVHLAPKK